jgi:heterodisulfide reductase subunit C
MNDAPVSILAYVLVGITSAVLAIVTILDKEGTENVETQESSVLTMLPELGNKDESTVENESAADQEPPVESETPVAVAIDEPIEETKPLDKVGGKKHKTRRNKHKKNKSSKKN